MKYRLTIFLLILTISCKSEKGNNTPKKHNPHEHINQNLENEKAIELYFKATESISKGNFELANKYLKESFQIEKSPIILNELGTIAIAEKKYQEALSYFDESIILDPTYYPSHINKSRSLTSLLDFKSAKNSLKDMLDKCESDYWKAYANLYLAYIYLHDDLNCEKAMQSIKKSELLKMEPELAAQYEGLKRNIEKNCGK